MTAVVRYRRYRARHQCIAHKTGKRFRLGIFQLLIHDLDKFLPSMVKAYTNHFYRNDAPTSREG